MYGWYVNIVKLFVRYGKFICEVWPIRHESVMMREYFSIRYGGCSDANRQVGLRAIRSGTWLDRPLTHQMVDKTSHFVFLNV